MPPLGLLATWWRNLIGRVLMFAAHRGIDLDAAFDDKWGRWLKD